ncbi:MAG: hypothetical protein PHG69_06295 [Candidatus Omnitrophica bacterium]|nr:hypothetical protein [Candidatus Omnitrophota bacterium]
MPEPMSMKVPVNSKHRIKVISSSDPEKLEKQTNDFLETISDEKLLVSMTFLAAGEYLSNCIYYRELSPMTPEAWEVKQRSQKKFAEGFIPKELLPDAPEITKL